MKQLILTFSLLVLFIGFCWGIAMSDDKPKKVTVFYFLFQATTFESLTIDLIEQKALSIFEFNLTSDKAKRLTQIINKTEDRIGNYRFNNLRVRLKIKGLFPHDIFVDQTGAILWGNKNSLGFKPDTFIELETLLEEWAEVKGCYS